MVIPNKAESLWTLPFSDFVFRVISPISFSDGHGLLIRQIYVSMLPWSVFVYQVPTV